MHIVTSTIAIELSKQSLLPMPEFPYIAQPFSHKRLKVMKDRYKAGVAISAALFKVGQPHYAPIVSTFPPSTILKNSNDSGFWVKLDEVILRRCDAVWVVMMPEWASSKGIKREVEFFTGLLEDRTSEYKRPIRFYRVEDIMDGKLHTFQILKKAVPWLPQLPNT